MNPYQKYVDTIQATMTSQATKQEKAATLQQTFNELAQVLRAELEGNAPAPATGDMVEAFKAAISPLAEQISLLNARLGVQTGVSQPQAVTYTVPQQKSMVAAPNMAAAVQQPALPISPVTGQPSEISAQVRRSVGLQ